ncbi:MAG TPA: hypothetical protein VHQ90_23695 [Thermoanaerobaculia bacterium]|nr:hypothetical protein [Thermoanaerobaculia bacterium]
MRLSHRAFRPLPPTMLPLLALLSGACLPAGAPARFPTYTEPIKQISERGGRLGWGGLEIGMSFRDVELALGQRLPPLGLSEREPACGFYVLETEARRQKLGLRFAGAGETGRLKVIWLRLHYPAGEASPLDLARALKARFPDLVYQPSPGSPDLAESVNPRPLYRTPHGALMRIDPQTGIGFGELCLN